MLLNDQLQISKLNNLHRNENISHNENNVAKGEKAGDVATWGSNRK